MAQNIPLRFVSKSRVSVDWTCPRARYWGYEFEGRGLTKHTTSLPLALGSILHDALAAIATYHQRGDVVDIDLIASLANQQVQKQLLDGVDGELGAVDFAREQAALVEGQVRGYYKYMWPRLLAMYPKILYIEQECHYRINDRLIFMARPDLIMGNDSGDVVYLEYKSTSSKSPEWVNSWDTAVQVHSSIKAVEQTLGITPNSVIVLGIYKGYASYGKQNSPFCYCYHKLGAPPFTTEQIQYDYRSGFKKKGTWELEGGTKTWVEEMPEEILANQFLLTPPIFINDDLVRNFFRQVGMREQGVLRASIAMQQHPEAKEDILNSVFPQRFDQCSPSYGYGCQFKQLCHGYSSNPLDEGFVYKEPTPQQVALQQLYGEKDGQDKQV